MAPSKQCLFTRGTGALAKFRHGGNSKGKSGKQRLDRPTIVTRAGVLPSPLATRSRTSSSISPRTKQHRYFCRLPMMSSRSKSSEVRLLRSLMKPKLPMSPCRGEGDALLFDNGVDALRLWGGAPTEC